MTARISDRVWELHSSGVHVDCRPARTKHGDGTPRSCRYAGKVERFHSHDFNGPLVCGCAEELS